MCWTFFISKLNCVIVSLSLTLHTSDHPTRLMNNEWPLPSPNAANRLYISLTQCLNVPAKSISPCKRHILTPNISQRQLTKNSLINYLYRRPFQRNKCFASSTLTVKNARICSHRFKAKFLGFKPNLHVLLCKCRDKQNLSIYNVKNVELASNFRSTFRFWDWSCYAL